MEARMIVVVVLLCTIGHFTQAQILSGSTLNNTITNTTCGTSKLCVTSIPGCNPSGNSTCYFSSAQYSNGVLSLEVSGTTSGYVALGLTPTGSLASVISPGVFVCGNNNNSFFFETALSNGTALNPADLITNISNIQGAINGSQSTIQCTFSTSINYISYILNNATLLNATFLNATFLNYTVPNITIFNSVFNTTITNFTNISLTNITTILNSTSSSIISSVFNTTIISSLLIGFLQLPFNVTIYNGTTNGTTLGSPNTVFTSNGPLDLANPKSNLPSSTPITLAQLNITRDGCGSSKLCFQTSPTCNLTGTATCFFCSVKQTGSQFYFELVGTTTGYVALGLTQNGTTVVFVCGNNSNTFFFQPASQNGTTLTPATLNTVYASQGVIAPNQSLIQCVFNTSTSFTNINAKSSISYDVTILNGTTNGTALGSPNTQYSSIGPLDLANPASSTPATTPTTLAQLNITRDGCGSSKLCFQSSSTCDLKGTATCYFCSVKQIGSQFYFELVGTTTGYVALGLAQSGTTVVFVCGNNSNTFFFQPAYQNSSTLTPATLNTVYASQGVIAPNQSLIQCVFNTSTSFTNINAKASTIYIVTILNGNTIGTQLGPANRQYDSTKAYNLSDPTALNNGNGVTSLCTNVLAVLLGALILHLL